MGKKIVVACDSFKGSLGSKEVGEAAKTGILEAMPDADVRVIAIADGGEGTVEAVVSGKDGEIVECEVHGPLGNKHTAHYGICGDMAVIEMAQASGITLIAAGQRNPWLTSSYGTGELIKDALRRGCRKFLVGIGGSATNDGGAGMLMALGFRFLDAEGKELGLGGGELSRLAKIDTSEVTPELKGASFTVACDVTNPLTGPQGASHIFGPQKGADAPMVEALDMALANFAAVVAEFRGEDLSEVPGTGAAGGMGFAFLALLGARLQPGIDMVLDAVGFDDEIRGAALIITGEGRLDRQTCMGKAPDGVLSRASKEGIPVVAIGGCLMPEAVPMLMEAGFKAVFPVLPAPCTLEEAMCEECAAANVRRTARQIINAINITL